MSVTSLLTALVRPLGRQVRAFLPENSGGLTTFVALVSPVLIGAMGLGGEVGYWYLTKQRLQNAADVAAHGSAIRLGNGDDEARINEFAALLTARADVDPANSLVTVNIPPLSGAFVEDSGAVEIIVTETVPRLFTAMYDPTPLELQARAVATKQEAGQACVLALNGTAEGAIEIVGTVGLTLVLCDIFANSVAAAAVESTGAALVTAGCIRAVGGVSLLPTTTLDCDEAETGASAIADPFAGLSEPDLVGNCEDGSVGKPNDTTTVTPSVSHPSGMSSIRYCNGLTLKGDVTLAPGLYLVEGGDFRINSNANVIGDGVVFFLAEGVNTVFNGTANVALSGPTVGEYKGVVIFAARDATENSLRLNGNLGSTIDGAIYAAGSELEFAGNVGTSALGCTQMVADTIRFSGNVAALVHCIFPVETIIESGGDVALVE